MTQENQLALLQSLTEKTNYFIVPTPYITLPSQSGSLFELSPFRTAPEPLQVSSIHPSQALSATVIAPIPLQRHIQYM